MKIFPCFLIETHVGNRRTYSTVRRRNKIEDRENWVADEYFAWLLTWSVVAKGNFSIIFDTYTEEGSIYADDEQMAS